MSGGAGRASYVLRRLWQAVPVVFAILVLNFLLLHLAPGDAAQVLAGEAGSATPEYIAQLRHRFGLDRPLALQLLFYVKNTLTLDLGFSFRHNLPVFDLILARLGPTLATRIISTRLAGVLAMSSRRSRRSPVSRISQILPARSLPTPGSSARAFGPWAAREATGRPSVSRVRAAVR